MQMLQEITLDSVPPTSAWISCLNLGQSAISGSGIFTTDNIPADTILMTWGGQLFTRGEVEAGRVERHTVVAIDTDLFLGVPAGAARTLDDYINHSCDGNVWMANAVQLIARRDIAAGEELTADYSIWLSDSNYVMRERCRCGSSLCRTLITGRDWLKADVRARYAGHFSPFLNRQITSGAKR